MNSNYSTQRPNIKSGDLIAWSNKSWGSLNDIKLQIIRIFTRSEYHHVGIAWVKGSRIFVIEAVAPMVRIFPLSKLPPFFHIGMDMKWEDTTEEFALSTVGDSYSNWQAIISIFGLSVKDNLWECAELAAAIYRLENIDVGTVYTPSAIVEQALVLGKQLKFINTK